MPHMSMETILKRIRQAFAFSNCHPISPIPIKVMWMRCFVGFKFYGLALGRRKNVQLSRWVVNLGAADGRCGRGTEPLASVLSRLWMFLVEVV